MSKLNDNYEQVMNACCSCEHGYTPCKGCQDNCNECIEFSYSSKIPVCSASADVRMLCKYVNQWVEWNGGTLKPSKHFRYR